MCWLLLPCSYAMVQLLPRAFTNTRKGTYNYKQISELALALTALWICISPLFKVANNYRQKGFESEISAHVILKESFYIYPQSVSHLTYCPTTSSSTCRVSAIAVLLSALALSHPVRLLRLINTDCIQDTRKRGLLNSFWHRPYLFLCQPWPMDQVFYSGYCSGNATLVCKSMCWFQGLEEHKFIRSSTGFAEWQVNLLHRLIKRGARTLIENGFGRVFPGPHLPQVRHPNEQGIKQTPISLWVYVIKWLIHKSDRQTGIMVNNNNNKKSLCLSDLQYYQISLM